MKGMTKMYDYNMDVIKILAVQGMVHMLDNVGIQAEPFVEQYVEQFDDAVDKLVPDEYADPMAFLELLKTLVLEIVEKGDNI